MYWSSVCLQEIPNRKINLNSIINRRFNGVVKYVALSSGDDNNPSIPTTPLEEINNILSTTKSEYPPYLNTNHTFTYSFAKFFLEKHECLMIN